MAIPAALKGESLTRLLQGTALGAIAAMIIGFNWGGWMLVSTAEEQASNEVESALVSALAPICVDRFQSSSDQVANLAALDEQSSYKRTGYIEDNGWAVLPGSDEAQAGVAKACAQLLKDI